MFACLYVCESRVCLVPTEAGTDALTKVSYCVRFQSASFIGSVLSDATSYRAVTATMCLIDSH